MTHPPGPDGVPARATIRCTHPVPRRVPVRCWGSTGARAPSYHQTPTHGATRRHAVSTDTWVPTYCPLSPIVPRCVDPHGRAHPCGGGTGLVSSADRCQSRVAGWAHDEHPL